MILYLLFMHLYLLRENENFSKWGFLEVHLHLPPKFIRERIRDFDNKWVFINDKEN